jgi:hypothetical protein
VLLRVTWQDAAVDGCVMERALQYLRPVASGQSKSAVQPL